MRFIISTQAELLKTKRTASLWLTIVGAALIPTIVFLNLTIDPGNAVKELAADPWKSMFLTAWQILAAFLLPMYIILISTLIPQIEFKNNTWKQVFSSPQSIGNIFFSKFLTIHILILLCFILFNVLMILSGVLINLINPKFTFLDRSVDWKTILRLNFKTYVSVLGISAFQYWLALRFKNFVAPVGIGLALLIGGVVALNLNWAHIYKYLYTYPLLSYDSIKKTSYPVLENHEWNSIGYLVFFMLIGFLDMRLRKEKG